MRPVITDFSAGELSPRMAGRLDIPVYYHGAQLMRNFRPYKLGGASKRGGLEYVGQSPDAAHAMRLIPWNISHDTDVMVAMYPGHIRILDVSGGMVPAWLTNPDATTFDITDLSPDDDVTITPYGASEIFDVQYAQCGSMLVMAHESYRPFVLEYKGRQDGNIAISYGIKSISGNIAFSPARSIDDEAALVAPDAIAGALRALTSGQSYTPDAGSYIYVGGVKKDITSIVITRTGLSRRLVMTDITGTDVYTIVDGASNFMHSVLASATMYASGIKVLQSDDFSCASAEHTMTGLMDAWYAVFGTGKSGVVVDGTLSTSTYNGLRRITGGTFLVSEYRKSTETYSIQLNYSGGSVTLTTADDEQQVYISIASMLVRVTGDTVNASEMIDYVLPWMERDVEYPCSSDYRLNDAVVLKAMKVRNTASGDDVLMVYKEGASAYEEISRQTLGVVGSIGVIVTPYYDRSDNPSSVAFHQNRLVFGGGKRANVAVASKPGDHFNFSYFEVIQYQTTSLKPASEWADPLVPETRTDTSITQQIGPSSAMRFPLSTEDGEPINWIYSVGDLIIGSASTEWVIPSDVTPMMPRAVQAGRNGSARIQARFFGSSLIFPSPSSRQVRAYSPSNPSVSPDIMRYAEHISGGNSIIQFDFSQDPEQVMYFVMSDGTMLALTVNDGMAAWSRIETDGIIESVAVVQASDEDAVYITLDRGGTRQIERLRTADESTAQTKFRADAFGVTTSSGAGAVTGFSRLNGETVEVMITSSGVDYFGTAVVGAGGFSTYTPRGAVAPVAVPISSLVAVGLPFDARLETFRIDSPETEGLEKAAAKMHLRVYSSWPFDIVREEDGTSYEVAFPDGASSPYTGAVSVELDSPARKDHKVIIESNDAVPVNILVVAPSYTVGGA